MSASFDDDVSGPSPHALLEQLRKDSLSVDKMITVCEKSAGKPENVELSEAAAIRMAMCFSGLAAQGALDRLSQLTLLRCFETFKKRSVQPGAKHLSSLLSFCKVSTPPYVSYSVLCQLMISLVAL